MEDCKKRQLNRVFSHGEFMKAVQLRFSRWFNRRAGRRGAFWEGRYPSVIVEEAERALRTMAACIDLNPVADYRWGGYSGAMAGKARSGWGLVRIIGQMACPGSGAAEAEPWGVRADCLVI